MPSIVTLTMNPAVDESTTVPYVLPGRKLRCQAPTCEPGGGGINVAPAIRKLGRDALACFPAAGPAGELLRRLRDAEGVPYVATPVTGWTRENLNVLEEVSGRQFRTVAVLFHEIPQELSDFGILIHSGLSVRRAVLPNLGSARAVVLRAVAALLLRAVSGVAVPELLIPITAGGLVHIAATDLIPELQHDRTGCGLFVQIGLMALGMSVMGVLAVLE